MNPLANDYVEILRSPDPSSVYCYGPGICRLAGGRLIATADLGGPGVVALPGLKGLRYGKTIQGKVFLSDDGGRNWRHATDFPFMMARPFTAGQRVYVLGVAGDLRIMCSKDGGETWSEQATLTHGREWTQAPSNVWHANGCLYLAMNERPAKDAEGWLVSIEAPTLMRASTDSDLTLASSWTFSESAMFRDFVRTEDLDYFGVPFYHTPAKEPIEVAPGRSCSPIGWLETNVIQIVDTDHYWYDPAGRTFHLWPRAHTGATGYAAIAKVVESGPNGGVGSMKTTLETAPSGRRMLYAPCPGGQMKFHLLYDEPTERYWLLSTQATDSMSRADRLPPERYGLPNNERRRLQLHFSRNMIDWCFAGLVAMGDIEKASRHYASMEVDGEDLHVLSRSGDAEAKNPHDTNFISFHTVKSFRDLVY